MAHDETPFDDERATVLFYSGDRQGHSLFYARPNKPTRQHANAHSGSIIRIWGPRQWVFETVRLPGADWLSDCNKAAQASPLTLHLIIKGNKCISAHAHTHTQIAPVSLCTDLFIVVQIQLHSAAFVDPRVVSETVSGAVTSDFFSPVNHFFGTSMGSIVTNQPSTYSLALSTQTPTGKITPSLSLNKVWLAKMGRIKNHHLISWRFSAVNFSDHKAEGPCDGRQLHKSIKFWAFLGRVNRCTEILWTTAKYFNTLKTKFL